jgi:hypothetical protein
MEEQDERLPAIVDYLRMHPTPPPAVDGQHVHIHHHYAPPPAPPPPQKPTVAEQVIPWLYFALMACIIGTICAFLLAAVMMILVIILLVVAVVAVILAYLIKTTRESQVNADLARAAADKIRRSR